MYSVRTSDAKAAVLENSNGKLGSHNYHTRAMTGSKSIQERWEDQATQKHYCVPTCEAEISGVIAVSCASAYSVAHAKRAIAVHCKMGARI